jgi:hypothetical protein
MTRGRCDWLDLHRATLSFATPHRFIPALLPLLHTGLIPEPQQVPPDPMPPRPRIGQKERLTIHLPVELIDRVKNAVYWTPGLTLAGLGEEALRRMVEQLEVERGDPFPPRQAELRGGRPLKM